VKTLKGSSNEYRLRVGDYRVLFALEGRWVTVNMLSATETTFSDEHCHSESQTQV